MCRVVTAEQIELAEAKEYQGVIRLEPLKFQENQERFRYHPQIYRKNIGMRRKNADNITITRRNTKIRKLTSLNVIKLIFRLG